MKRYLAKGADPAALFAGKAGGIFLNIVFLPIYFQLMPAKDFGAASVLLSLQSLALVLDFGMATLVGRDVAPGLHSVEAAAAGFQTYGQARKALSLAYGGLAAAALAYGIFARDGVSGVAMVASVVLVGLLVQTNVSLAALVSLRLYRRSSLMQVSGHFARAVLTVLALRFWRAGFDSFVLAQLLAAFVQAELTRCQAVRTLAEAAQGQVAPPSSMPKLLRRAAPLVLFGAMGAATMQLDKSIAFLFMSPEAVGPYFLACTYALTPIAVLAGPVAQYFQPILSADAHSENDLTATLKIFAAALITVVGAPSIALWWFRNDWIGLWLGRSEAVPIVADYVAVLLPATAVGAIGYLPTALLIAVQEFSVLGRVSTALGVIILGAELVAAAGRSLLGLVAVYAVYHLTSTLALWWWILRSRRLRGLAEPARSAAYRIGAPLTAALLGAAYATQRVAAPWLAPWLFIFLGEVLTLAILAAMRSSLTSFTR